MIHWFPGHMARAQRGLEALLKGAEVVLAVLDARAPLSSHHQDLAAAARGRVILVLNKADLAEQRVTKAWVRHFERAGQQALPLSPPAGLGLPGLRSALEKVRRDVIARRRLQNRKDEDVRAVVVGIPNTGKSTVINLLAGRRRAATGRKAGLTRGPQWVNAGPHLSLLDSPGIFYPKIRTEAQGLHLALIGAIQDERLPMLDVGMGLVSILAARRRLPVVAGYDPDQAGGSEESAQAFLEALGRARGLLGRGSEVNLEHAAAALIRQFRDGRLGPLSLEVPPDAATPGPIPAVAPILS